MTQAPLLHAQHISLTDSGRLLLDNIELSVAPKEILTIIGPNGAGKTTLLNILLGLQKPSNGHVTRRPGLRIGYMPQRLHLNPLLPLTVKRFLELADSRKTTIPAALSRTGVSHLLLADMHRLSGGELQRVLLARALLRQPELLVLDEPVQGVDLSGQNQLYQLITHLRDELHCGVLMVSHDLHLVMAATDHVICLNQHICCHGHPEKVSNDPAYLALFGRAASNLATYTHHHDHVHGLHGEVVEQAGHTHCHHGDH